jgi:hypothetical protein
MKTLRFKQLPLVLKIAVESSFTARGGQSRNLLSTVMGCGNICRTIRWLILVSGTLRSR